jgi:hypothetical protein
MKYIVLLLVTTINVIAQTNPIILSWMQNTTVVGSYYMKNNSTPISNNIKANVQLVRYSSNSVYISTNGIPTYPTGPFLDGNPSQAQSQNAIFKFPLTPQKNMGTPSPTTPGNIGIFINGVALFDYRDGVSWKNSMNKLQGGPLGGMGDNVWNRDAVVAERIGFDCAKGHPAMGNYHHHQNPSAFKLDKNVISDICSLYDADGLYTINPSIHSPLIGFAYDGFPIYGAYGYKNADGSGGIVRLKSSFQLRSITVRTHYADGTDVLDGPPVSATYPLGYFREDYVFIAHTEEDYLDDHNGRFCVTPEYPNGTYAYFSTVDDNWNSTYPYVVGPTFYGVKSASKVTSVTEPTTVYTPIVPTLSISPQSITIPAEASLVNITVSSNTQWTVSSNQAWAIPSQSQGNGNAIIGIQCQENTQVGNRNAIITFSAIGLPSTYATITQKDSVTTLSVNKQTFIVPAYKHIDSSINITSNAQWTIETSDSWLHIFPMQGNGDKTLSILIDENVLNTQRTGTFAIKTTKGISTTVTITQLDSLYIPLVMKADIDTVFLYAGMNSYSFKLVSNTPWKVITPANWLTVSPDSGITTVNISCTAKANTGKNPRSTIIQLTGEKVQDIIIPVIQKDSIVSIITLASDTLHIPAKMKVHTVSISSNVAWKANSQTPWIHMKSDTGNGSALLSFIADENESNEKRKGSIIMEGKGSITKTLTIVQSDTVLKPSNIDATIHTSLLRMFPNPTNDILIIQAQSIIREDIAVSIHDINGRLLAKTTLLQGSTIAYFDCSTLYNGSYFVSMKGQGIDETHSIIINHQ